MLMVMVKIWTNGVQQTYSAVEKNRKQGLQQTLVLHCTAALFPAVRMQTTSVSTNRWKDKPNTVHTYNGLVLSRGKE